MDSGSPQKKSDIALADALNTLGYDAYSLKFGMPSWAIAEGHQEWEVLSCEPYICITMPEERCQDMLGQGVKVEDTYKVDFSDCS